MKLTGKVAVITGTAHGIGKATAHLFAKEGATVICIDQDSDANNEVVDDINNTGGIAFAFNGDVSDEDSVQQSVEFTASIVSQVDILFNNAGIVDEGNLESSTLETWEYLMRNNVQSVFLMTKSYLPLLKKSEKASIILNASIDGLFGNPNVPIYSASKGGLIPLTHVMGWEFAAYNIRTNCIAAGGIASEMTNKFPSERIRQVIHHTPLKRFGTPEEVANVALFLGSEESSYVNGSVIVVDGGRTGLTPGTL